MGFTKTGSSEKMDDGKKIHGIGAMPFKLSGVNHIQKKKKSN